MKILTSFLRTATFTFLVFLSCASIAQAGQEVTRFQFPDVRDDFCGIHINYQYCKCAFHNKFCDDISLSPSTANTYVWDEYRKWVRESINATGVECDMKGGIWSTQNRSCTICTDPHVNTGTKCEKSDKEESDEDEGSDEASESNQDDCSVDENFDKDWQKYSDIDERLGEGERSYEAGQYASTIESIVEMKGWIFEIKTRMEVERVKRLEMRNIREALVHNQKVNLLKAFWRLTYVTYSTIDSTRGAGKNLVDAIGADNVVTGLAKGIKFIQGNTPSSAATAIDTKELKGKVKSVGANAALEAVDTLGDPIQIITKIAGDSVKATYPSADISPEEIQILRDQYLRNRKLDVEIQNSYLESSGDKSRLLSLEKELVGLEAQAAEWKSKEKARVKNFLEQSCKDKKKK